MEMNKKLKSLLSKMDSKQHDELLVMGNKLSQDLTAWDAIMAAIIQSI